MSGVATGARERTAFWSSNQPGFRFSGAEPGTAEFFAEVERHRYELEPCIPEVARFGSWAGKDVLEAGCGIATDGAQFARAGARYTGLDFSPAALQLARERFELEGSEGNFVEGSVTDLPFEPDSFDLVYSNGVIHHVPDTAAAVREFHRVLRPGGRALVMLYHRDSLNYRGTILGVRRALAGLLLVPGTAGAIARLTGEQPAVLEGHAELLREHGMRYLTDTQLFLSNNTDGPGNPLSKVYSRREAGELFVPPFDRAGTRICSLNLRIYPGGQRFVQTELARRLERRWGWHLWIEARKDR